MTGGWAGLGASVRSAEKRSHPPTPDSTLHTPAYYLDVRAGVAEHVADVVDVLALAHEGGGDEVHVLGDAEVRQVRHVLFVYFFSVVLCGRG